MPYEITIKEQETGKQIKKQIESLKDLKDFLIQYQNKLIDFDMNEIKKLKKK